MVTEYESWKRSFCPILQFRWSNYSSEIKLFAHGFRKTKAIWAIYSLTISLWLILFYSDPPPWYPSIKFQLLHFYFSFTWKINNLPGILYPSWVLSLPVHLGFCGVTEPCLGCKRILPFSWLLRSLTSNRGKHSFSQVVVQIKQPHRKISAISQDFINLNQRVVFSLIGFC